jgi:hypothetical protein
MDNPQHPPTFTGTHLILAALLFGVSLIATALILHHGLTTAADHLSLSINHHAETMSTALPRAGDAAGVPIAKSVDVMAERLSRPVIKFASPVPIEQPVTIQGPRGDGSLPVNATVGK